MKILRTTLVALLSLTLIPLTSCDSGEKPLTSLSISLCPSSPINVELSISKLPILNETVELTCKVSSKYNAPNSTAQIKLSNGARLISGNLQWQGDLVVNVPVSFSAQVVFEETGHHTIEAIAQRIIDDKNSWGDLDAIYLDIGSETSTFGWPFTPVAIIQSPNEWSVIQTDVEISHAPRLHEPAKLYFTILIPRDFPGLYVSIFLPSSALLSDSDVELTKSYEGLFHVTGVDLKAGTPCHFSATVVFEEIGYCHVTLATFQKVDGVTYSSPQDTIYLKIGVNESTFEQEPPKDIPAGPTPPSINPDGSPYQN